MVVWGTRPELTKLQSVVDALRQRGTDVLVWHTGQHSDLITNTLDSVGLRDIVTQSRQLAVTPTVDPCLFADHVATAVTSHLSNLTTPVFGVIVQGDTASAYGACRGARRWGAHVAHVEAGVRTGNQFDPWPEESFRIAIDREATWHFAPTKHCAKNLDDEGIYGTVHVTGNTGIDALWNDFTPHPKPPGGAGVLITLHRRERWPLMGALADAIDRVAQCRTERFIWPVHPNPVLQTATHDMKAIRTRGPLGHHAFREVMQHSKLVITDSGGVQEEAAALGVPCLVVREVTDRPESVVAGHARVVGTNPDTVALRIWEELDHPTLKTERFLGYGDGTAGYRIAEILLGR